MNDTSGAQTGTLALGGATPFVVSGTGTSTFALNGTGSTVIYNSSSTQTVLPVAYTNLTLAGGGIKSINTGTTISGNLSINGATASLAAGLNLNVGSLTIGGLNKINGTWGSSASAASINDNTYFTSTGIVTVTSDTRPVALFSGLSASQGICFGTATTVLSGTVSAPGPVYSLNGETVVVTINGNAQNATVAGGSGGFTVNFPTSALLVSATPYTISYAYAGDVNLKQAANNTSTTVTVNPVIIGNAIGSPQTICINTAPSGLTGTLPTGGSGTYGYLWQSSTTSGSAGFAPAAGTSNGQNYSPGSLTQTTWFTRTVTSGGCSTTSASVQITVTPLPVATFSYAGTPYCWNGSNPTPTFSGGGVAGTFSSTSGLNFVSTATGQINPATSTPGTYTVTNTLTAAGGCGIVTATSQVTINPRPAITSQSTGGQTVCAGSAFTSVSVTATGAGLNYQWYSNTSASTSGSSLITGATGSSYTPPSAIAGTLYYYCVVTGTCGTVTSAVSGAFVVNSSVGGTINGAATEFCKGGSTGTMTLSGYSGTILEWDRQLNSGGWNNVGNYAIATYSEVPYAGGTWQYRALVQNGSCPAAYSSVVTVLVDPTTTIGTLGGGPTLICQGALTGVMTLGPSTGSIIRWEKRVNSGSWINIANTLTSYSEIPSSAGTWDYRVLVQSGNCSSLYSNNYTIVVTPTLSITLGPNPIICKNTTIAQLSYTATTGSPTNFTINFDGAALNAGMVSQTGWQLNANAITINVPYGIATGVYNGILSVLTYNPVCSSISYPITVTIQDNNQTIAITGSAAPCQGSSQSYSATNISGAAYTWTFPAGWVQTGGGTTSSVTVSVGSANGNIQVTPSFACGNGTTQTLGVAPVLVPSASIAYPGTPFCKSVSASQNVILTGTAGGTYAASPTGLTINSFTGAITPVSSTAGTYIVTYSIPTSGGCGVITATATVTITTTPVATFSYTGSPFCSNAANPLPTFSGGGAAGTFSSTSGLVFVSSATGQVNLSASTPGTYTVTNTIPAAGGCSQVTATSSITINPTLPVSLLITPSSNPVCPSTSVTFTAAPTNGGTAPAYQWKVNGTTVGTNSPTYTYTPANSDIVSCLLTSNALCAAGSPATSNVVTMSISANPTVSAGGTLGAVCQGGTTTALGGSFGGGATAAVWSDGGAGGTFANNTGNTPSAATYTASAIFTNPVTLTLTTSGLSCGTVSANKLLTVTPSVTINAFSPATATRCQGAGTVTTTATATNSSGITYTLDAASLAGGNTIVAATGAVTYSAGWSGTTTISASAAGCNGPAVTTLVVTVTPTVGTPVFVMGTTSTRCRGAGSVTYSANATNNTGITYTLDAGSIAGGNTIASGTGTVTYNFGWKGTSIITASATGCNGPTSSVHTATTITDLIWTGAISSDWNTTGNWSCLFLPDLTTNVLIPNVTNQPVLNSGSSGMANNIVINSGSSITVTGNTLQIAGSITNSGTFTASAGTIQMQGTSAQTIGAGTFAGNSVMNFTVSNTSGVTLAGPLSVTGVVKAATGDLTSGGNLVLISSASQTALVDGSGSGNVVGNVTMQRYLPSAFGYKYISSPFQAADVSRLSSYINLGATFPSFYKYDENNHHDSTTVTGVVPAYQSGWVSYTSGSNPLVPQNGYAANFGTSGNPETINLSGVVNNGTLLVSMINHNRKYTQGFNLAGNPYPSPIDWNASGWTKTNIDNAIYFFNADGSDQYSGVYTSYVNGTGTGNGTNLIASMQGFFIHVSDGSYPVSGTLGMTNAVRVNNLAPTFREATTDNRTILRFAANLETPNPLEDVALLYFDNQASRSFKKELDALKLNNTTVLVPNLYTLSTDPRQLSIYAIPQPADSTTKIPVGITTLGDGWVDFKAKDIALLPQSLYIYLADNSIGITQDLKKNPDYRFYLKAGTYNQRFNLIFSLTELNAVTPVVEKIFNLKRSAAQYTATINLPGGSAGSLFVTNMSGQIILLREVFDQQAVEINPGPGSGLYIITVISGNRRQSEKILIH